MNKWSSADWGAKSFSASDQRDRPGRRYSVHESKALLDERNTKRLANVTEFSNTLDARPTDQRFTKIVVCMMRILCSTVKGKTITIREDQDEWIGGQHLNSSFVREQSDEPIEKRE